jgi:FixJ family two-component response regulator
MTDAAIIYVVDDDASFRTATGELLNACGYQTVLYESAHAFLSAQFNRSPACILLDVQMEGLSGPQLQGQLTQVGCVPPIIFISGYGDIPTTVQTIKAGAEDFLTKPVPMDTLLSAIGRALAKHQAVVAQDEQVAGLRELVARLTSRERDVFSLLVRGKLHKQIAYELGTSERTIKLHRHNVMKKCQVRSLAELAVIAERLGLLARHDALPRS